MTTESDNEHDMQEQSHDVPAAALEAYEAIEWADAVRSEKNLKSLAKREGK